MGEFSTNLARARTEKQVSQEELASRVGVSQAAISQYEVGSSVPKITIAVKIASVLGTTCEELMKGESCETEQAQNPFTGNSGHDPVRDDVAGRND